MNYRTLNTFNQLDESNSLGNRYNSPVIKTKESLANNLQDDSPENREKMKAIDKLQLALDVAGFEPTYGTIADIINIVISTFRSLLATEKDERKRHIINAGISAISIIPFADVIKILKLRKSPKVAKAAIKGARAAKNYAKREKIKGDRFVPSSRSENKSEIISEIISEPREIYMDPYQIAAEDDEYYAKAA